MLLLSTADHSDGSMIGGLRLGLKEIWGWCLEFYLGLRS